MEVAGIAILAAVLIAAIAAPRASFRAWRRLMAVLGAVGRRPWAAALLCAAFSVAGSVAYALVVKWPEPRGHDEFSYLLAADTFRHGRLANPMHPMWQFFETFHVIQHPTYASKFPPVQGLILAAGWWLGGHPIAGVWASGALMSAVMWWMLRGFMPARWALAGGLIAAAQLGATTDWTQTYWGGCPAAIGGALVLGALPRLRRRDGLGDSAAFGLGLAILANSRPFEGAVMAFPAGCMVAWIALRRARISGARAFFRTVAPAVIILALIGVCMAVYDRAVTGNPLRLPYMEHESQYAVAPVMLWLPAWPVPAYRHDEIRRYWAEANLAPYLQRRSLSGFVRSLPSRSYVLWQFYLGPVLTLAFLGLPGLLRKWWGRLALASVVLFWIGLMSSTWTLEHYAAPGAALIILLVTGCLRSLSVVTVGGRRIGLALVFAVILIFLVKPVLRTAFTTPVGPPPRVLLISRLSADPARKLVVVRYGTNRSLHSDWVFNGADIDGSPIVWARDMGDSENRRLLDYYPDRQAWLLEVGFGDSRPDLRPYPR